jgi:hypothetical protein
VADEVLAEAVIAEAPVDAALEALAAISRWWPMPRAVMRLPCCGRCVMRMALRK